jgi:single-strand DNA-binding protein
VAWRKLGEICGQYLHKGSKIYIEGRLQTRDWQTPDGVKHYRTEIVAENMIMLDTKGSSASRSDNSPAPSNDFAQPEPAAGEDEIQVENIPF